MLIATGITFESFDIGTVESKKKKHVINKLVSFMSKNSGS